MPWHFSSLWADALPYHQFVKESREHCELWTGVYRTAKVPPWARRDAERLGRRFRLVVLAEEWCGDASSTVPILARWAEETGVVELRVLRRDKYPQVMDQYLTNGTRSIPLVIVLTEDMEELGRWGPRPAELQAFVLAQRAGGRASSAYFVDTRRWYAKDKGESTLREVLQVMAGGVPQP